MSAMDGKAGTQSAATTSYSGILEIQSFHTAFDISSREEDDARRRFSTLFTSASSSRAYGANGFVTKASNAYGEIFAVKQLRLDPDAGQTPNAFQSAPSENALRAFKAEYENQCHVSNLKGFPRLYGWGMSGDNPIIVMEWIDGISLADFLKLEANDNGTDWNTVANMGASLFGILSSMQMLESAPVHRDLSPRNLILRTSKTSLDEQLANGDFDLCVIDFGSMTVVEEYDPRLTSTTDIFRRATPEYAPPEMLADNLANIIELRQSPSIDVYAACSVLYELASGHTPFSLYARDSVSPYEVKTTETPESLELEQNNPAIAALAQGIMQGLSPVQADRPTARKLQELCLAVNGKSQSPTNANALSTGAQYPGRVLLTLSPENGGASVINAVNHQQNKPSGKKISRRGFIGGIAAGVAAIALGGFGATALLRATDRQDSGESASSDGALPSMSQEDINAGNQLFPVKDPTTTLWGYVTKTGEWAIEPRFINAARFSEGVACVTEDNATMRFINPSGGYAIDKSLDIATNNVHTVSFSENLAAITGSDSKTPGTDYYYGVINMNGDWVIEPIYASIGSFHQGLAAFRYDSNSKCGYLDASGQIAISSQFYTAGPFTDDKLAVAAAGKNQYGWIYTNGGWLGISEPTYAFTGAFSEGLAFFVPANSGGLYGFANTSGAEVIPPTFKGAHCFESGRCPAQDASTGLWGLIDTNASWTLKPQYADMGWFHNGLVAVKDATSGLCGYINSDGEVAVPLRYSADESTGLV